MNTTMLLVVEDQAVIALDLESRLERNGYKVCGVAASGAEALALARRHRPALVLMDIRIQGEMDGIETADILRREFDVPVIFLSAHVDEATLLRAKTVGSFGFLTKPFEERELQLNIEMALNKHEGERKLALAHEEIRTLNESLEARVRERTAELEKAVAEIEGFVHVVTHHLRSPLRAIQGYSGLIQSENGANLSGESARFLGAVGANASRMMRMLDDLLSFLSLRQQVSNPQLVDITSVASDVVAALAAKGVGNLTQVTVDALPACRADPLLLRQLFVELLANAFRFSRDRQPAIVEVGARRGAGPQGQHVYFVRDNGIGIDARFSGELFKLFSQMIRTEADEGSGAGLAKARRIMERLGGEIWAEPAPGGGALFSFSLPGCT